VEIIFFGPLEGKTSRDTHLRAILVFGEQVLSVWWYLFQVGGQAGIQGFIGTF